MVLALRVLERAGLLGLLLSVVLSGPLLLLVLLGLVLDPAVGGRMRLRVGRVGRDRGRRIVVAGLVLPGPVLVLVLVGL